MFSWIIHRPHKDFAGFQIEAQRPAPTLRGKSRTFCGIENSRQNYIQPKPLILPIPQNALAGTNGEFKILIFIIRGGAGVNGKKTGQSGKAAAGYAFIIPTKKYFPTANQPAS